MSKKIAIITWWPWLERDIAIKSSDFFKKYLNKEFDYFVLPEEIEDFLAQKNNYELVIPVFHWEYWEDWKIFALLDLYWIKYCFSDHSTHSICLDKYKSNILASDLWINIPNQFILWDWDSNLLWAFAVIVKPNKWWSSFHTYKVDSDKEFKEKIAIMKREVEDDILVQEYITWDEYSVPIVNWEILPIMKLEKNSQDDFFDYESKYESEKKIRETWPEIDSFLKEQLEVNSLKIYDFFNIKWFCRIDFLVRNNEVFFLEINTIPWMTEASILPKSWKLTWRSFEELISKLIN